MSSPNLLIVSFLINGIPLLTLSFYLEEIMKRNNDTLSGRQDLSLFYVVYRNYWKGNQELIHVQTKSTIAAFLLFISTKELFHNYYDSSLYNENPKIDC